ncbi:MAG: LEA type 2 family protein [Treponema sp.]|jgi:LEA14-like dessication related protein|nr:LEA type 2 family protein [Treponema sp.]
MKKYLIILFVIVIFAACKSPPPVVEETFTAVIEHIVEPEIEIIEPEFDILSIVIIQGELINTQFEAVLKIDNPNTFDMELSELKYQLYGNGLFWADGLEKDIFLIPALSSSENKFRFSMNFINMNRRLLDDVIAMRQVQYRFAGEVIVQALIPRVLPFTMKYDISGLSEVKPKAD